MLDSTLYAKVIKAATQIDPFGKKIDDESIGLMYLTLDDRVKQSVTNEMLIYALKQHRLDPAPDKSLNIEQQILQHIYRCENGAPNIKWGLKQDLQQRMASPDRFHGQPKSAYELGSDLKEQEPRFAPNGVLAQIASWENE